MKQNAFIATSGVVILIAVTAMVMFVRAGETPPVEEIDLDGVWRVVTSVENDSATLIENEFLVFDLEKVTVYRDSLTEPLVSGEYIFTDTNELQIPDLAKNYRVEQRTDNYLRFYEGPSDYLDIVRSPELSDLEVEADWLHVSGRWDVIFRTTDEVVVDESLVFDDGELQVYRNGEQDPAITTDYEWDGNVITVDALGMELILYPITEDTIILVEMVPGYVWELQKAD